MKNKTLRILALLLAFCMIFACVACGNNDAESTAVQDDILYGNAVDDEDIDDEIPDDALVVDDESDKESSSKDGSKNSSKTSSAKKENNSSNSGKNSSKEQGTNSGNTSAKNPSNSDKTASGSSSTKTPSNSGNASSGGSSAKETSNADAASSGDSSDETPSYSSNVGKVESTYEVDEDAKEKFFKSVPASLKGKTVRVLIWWKPGVTESKKAEVFEKRTGIKIKFVTCGSGDAYYTKLAALIGQDNAPDLACITQSNFPNAVIQNYFEPLSVGKLDLNDKIYDKQTMDYFKWNDKYYGAMVKSSTMITFYCCFFNKSLYNGMENPYDLWQANKWNWDTLVSSTQKVMSANKNLKAGIVGDYSCHFFAQTSGADLVEFNNGKIINNCNNADILKGYQKLSELKNKEKILTTGTNYQQFVAGQAALLFTGNYIMQTGDIIDQTVKFDWGVVPMPSPAGSKTVIPSSVKLWGFSRGAKNTEAASYWLRYWLDESFDEEGYNLWTNEEAKVFNNWLWEQDKQFINWTGIVEFGGNYKSDNVITELVNAEPSSMKAEIDKWSSVIDSNIKNIMSRQ